MKLPSRPRPRPDAARFVRAGTAAVLAVAAAMTGIAACSTDPRKSGEGESCQATDDCADPLRCVALVCVQPGMGTGGAPGTTVSATTVGSTTVGSTTTKASSTSGTASSSTGTVLDPELCEMCLDMKCATQLAACDDACLSVEACIEAACKSLVENGLPDEGMCQVYCQNQYPGGKQKHLDVANCSQAVPCAPCSSNPFDYDDCRVKADAGPCADEKMACTTDADCAQYSNCAATCQSLSACVACQGGTSGMAGYTLALAYERCIASECIAESWLP